ncbi:Hypp6098 [Branchiostoma lanceolatum]|uniref:Hypp6098 protein n=1 Tax=Branchiostoma lanceolatum TaxID=7740 RepID=A0A8J9VIV6_BRALA|nr:Hypp6098 [Branchiostoma lanceolatum]
MKGLDRRAKNKYAYAPEHVQSMPPFSVLLVGALLVLLIAVGLPWLYSSRYPETLKSQAADNIRARSSRSEQAVHTHVVRDGRPGPFPGAAAQRVTRQPAPRAPRSIMATVLPIYGIGIGAYVLFTMYKVFGGKERENDMCSSTKNRDSSNQRARRRQDNSCQKGFSLFGQKKKRMKGRINQDDLQKLKEKIAETEQLMQKALADMAATVHNVGAEHELQGQLGRVRTEGGGEGAETNSPSDSEQIKVQNKTADSHGLLRARRGWKDEMGSDATDFSQIATNECQEVRSGVSDDHDTETSREAADSCMEKPDVTCLESEEIIDVEEISSDLECQAVLRQRNVERCPGNQNDMHTEME